MEDLIKSKVIIREDDPQDWCSLDFFVLKADGINVRMVTGDSKINRFVKRPVHPFQSVADIVRSIPAGTKFFGYTWVFSISFGRIIIKADYLSSAFWKIQISSCTDGIKFLF